MNSNNSFLGKWGLYQWFDERGIELIHPEDVDDFKALMPNGKVFECIKDDGRYIFLKYADKTYRVIRDIFKPVKKPEKIIGEAAILKGSPEKAIIVDITWHFQRKAHMYFIAINGKRKSNRYWIEDFEF
ncbi:MAG: hypothetical protein GY874_07945 [Desulfobacteraceae bacterium]|nr:hypothetical protein [Desulfobacteraceae bacterium]